MACCVLSSRRKCISPNTRIRYSEPCQPQRKGELGAAQVVAVDAYAWLHRGIHACTWELGCGGSSDKHIIWCMARVALMLHYHVKPLLIFDGGPLPAKAGQEASRRARREEARARALQCAREHRHEDARKWFARAIDVTPEMAARFIDACVMRWGRDSVDYMVAPYEADAQLAFSCRCGEAAAVISEDSDNLAYGTPRVLFKLEADGMANEVVVSELFNPNRPPSRSDNIDVRGWTATMFATMCALAGCDYIDSVRGVGIKVAHRLVARNRDLRRVVRALRFEYGAAVPSTYERDVECAILTFAHQTVFCRKSKATMHLTPLPDDVKKRHDEFDFLGRLLPENVAIDIAEARLEPNTRHALKRSTIPSALSHASLVHATRDLELKTKRIDEYFRAQPRTRSGRSSAPQKQSAAPAFNADEQSRTIVRSSSTQSASSTATAIVDKGVLQIVDQESSISPQERDRKKPKIHEARRSNHFAVERMPATFPCSNFKLFKVPKRINLAADNKENLKRLDTSDDARCQDSKRVSKRIAPFEVYAFEPQAQHDGHQFVSNLAGKSTSLTKDDCIATASVMGTPESISKQSRVRPVLEDSCSSSNQSNILAHRGIFAP